MLRVGILSYVNALPFRAKEPGPYQWQEAVPTHLNRMLSDRQLDIALTSAIHYLRHPARYQLLPYGIGCSGPVRSVKLYYRGSLSSLHQNKIGVTRDSAMALQLAKTLTKSFWGIEPAFIPMKTPPDSPSGYLLIGDACLRHTPPEDMQELDLGEAWMQATGHALPFALWIAQKSVSLLKIQEFNNYLEEQLQWYEGSPEEVHTTCAKRVGLAKESASRYFSGLQFHLTDSHRRGLELLQKYAVPQKQS